MTVVSTVEFLATYHPHFKRKGRKVHAKGAKYLTKSPLLNAEIKACFASFAKTSAPFAFKKYAAKVLFNYITPCNK